VDSFQTKCGEGSQSFLKGIVTRVWILLLQKGSLKVLKSDVVFYFLLINIHGMSLFDENGGDIPIYRRGTLGHVPLKSTIPGSVQILLENH
jgi:hypothetical protein